MSANILTKLPWAKIGKGVGAVVYGVSCVGCLMKTDETVKKAAKIIVTKMGKS